MRNLMMPQPQMLTMLRCHRRRYLLWTLQRTISPGFRNPRMLALAQASTWRTRLTHWGPSPRVAGCYALHHSGTRVRWAQGLTYLPRRTTEVSRRHAQLQAGLRSSDEV